MPITEPTILPLAKAAPALLNLVGGKAANLGELLQAGFPVPDGFCITTAAYAQFTAWTHVEPLIAQLLALPTKDDDGRAAIAARLRQRLEAAPIPADLMDAITSAYRQLGPEVPVAVRSSATAEDLPGASFAGQQDTFLNVVGEQALLDAVRRCWASLWTDRAIAYRERQGLDTQSVKLAVVVQQLVPADHAGVLFTANPITGARDETVIDGNAGLGEAVVSAQVTPDHWVLRKGRWGWHVAERRPGRRELAIRARPGGGTESVGTAGLAALPALPGRALRQLARIGVAIERHFGHPQDIEWAWAKGKLFVLQARPMTALPEPLLRLSPPVQMLTAMFAEMFPVRPYPLDQTGWVPAISAGAVEPIFQLLGLDVPSVASFFVVEDGVVERFSGRITFRPTAAVLLAPARFLWLALRYDPRCARTDPGVLAGQGRVRALEAIELATLSWPELLAVVHEALALPLSLAGQPRQRYLPRAVLAAGLLWVVVSLLGRGHQFSALLSGAESRTLEANRALEALAAGVRANPALTGIFQSQPASELPAALAMQPAGRAFLAELQEFLHQYGHREVVFSTALQPTWQDSPELVLRLIQGLVQTAPTAHIGRPAWKVALDEVLAHPLLQHRRVRRVFMALVDTARCLWQVREDTHFEATRSLPILRRALLEMGRRLAVAGVLDCPEAVFHLEFDELERAGGPWPPPQSLAAELRAGVLRRQARRAALGDTPVIDPRFYQSSEPQGEVLLRGAPGSPGVAEGVVRVIRGPAEFGQLRSGEVLVAPYTNPAWTLLFGRASAVVVDGGAASSHAAIVAREYGIPAVMGTVAGTQVLHNGERVRVSGDQGWVARLE